MNTVKQVYYLLPQFSWRQNYVRLVSQFCQLFSIDSLQGKIDNTSIYVSSQDNWGIRKFYFSHNYNDVYRQLIKTILQSEQITFWDIGANYGAYALTLSQYATKTIAVEPNARNFQHLQKSCQTNDLNIHCEQCLVDCYSGEAYLYLSPEHAGDHRIFVPKEEKYRDKELVKVKSIDQLSEENFNQIPSYNLIKIDVQGAETNVVKGAKKLIAQSDKIFVFLEVWPKGLQEAGSSLEELFDTCSQLGLQVAKIFCFKDANESKFSISQISPISWQEAIAQIQAEAPQTVWDVLLFKK